jgi:hypothetical protein
MPVLAVIFTPCGNTPSAIWPGARPPLGQKFRSIILNRQRKNWWTVALRQTDARLKEVAAGGREGAHLHFPVLIERDEDGWYIGSVPSLKGCHTQARLPAELDKRDG